MGMPFQRQMIWGFLRFCEKKTTKIRFSLIDFKILQGYDAHIFASLTSVLSTCLFSAMSEYGRIGWVDPLVSGWILTVFEPLEPENCFSAVPVTISFRLSL